MENKFKKGLILGGLLSVVAAIGFAMTKDGQHLTEELQEDLKMLAKHLKKNLHLVEDVTKESFDKLVVTIVEEYSKVKELTAEAKDALVTELQSKWDETEKEYLAEKDKMNEEK